jgi:arylsulfatase A-like enzyme
MFQQTQIAPEAVLRFHQRIIQKGIVMKYKVAIEALALTGVFAGAALNAEAEKLNVLFLTVDDLKPVLGCYGFEGIKTPNIDRLAARGTVMLNNYCQQAICAPSRMSMFTGLRPDTTKVWDLKTHLRTVCPSAVTMQQYFKESGYETAGSGKVMHGSKDEDPISWTIPFRDDKDLKYADGFPVPAHDNCFYQGKKEQEVYKELQNSGIKDWKVRFKWMGQKGAMPATECLDIPDDAYADGAQTTYNIALLEKFSKAQKPFFLTVGFHKPHLPFVAPKKYWDLYDREKIDVAPFQEHAKNSPGFAYHTWGELRSYSDIPDNFSTPLDQFKQKELIHAYYACVSYTDAQVGRLLDKLDELGLAENTIIVLWGDHGWHLGDHGMWCKHSNFEQATRAPLIIAAPGYKGGQKTKSMSEFVDIYPTLCELANLPLSKKLEGVSLVPVLKDPMATVKDYSVSQYPREGKRMGYTLRTERYRLVMWMKNDFRSTQKFDEALVDAVELYDYEKDPLEKVSQQDNPEYKDVVIDLKQKMLEYFQKYAQ